MADEKKPPQASDPPAAATSTAKTETKPPVKALSKIDTVLTDVRAMEVEFKRALPTTMRADHFVRVLVTTIRASKYLIEVANGQNSRTIYAEALKAAQDGLLLDGREAALTKFGDSAKYMPMVAGYCKRARNSGEIGNIDSKLVYEQDEWKYWIDEKGPHFNHVENLEVEDRGKLKLAYAYAITKDGFLYFEPMTLKELAAIEGVSKNKGDSPYTGPFRSEMQRKAPLRRLLKYRVPSAADTQELIDRDNDLYDLEARADKATPVGEKPVKTSRIGKIVKADAARQDDPEGRDEPSKEMVAKKKDDVPI